MYEKSPQCPSVLARKQVRAVELADFYMKWKNLNLNDTGYAELV